MENKYHIKSFITVLFFTLLIGRVVNAQDSGVQLRKEFKFEEAIEYYSHKINSNETDSITNRLNLAASFLDIREVEQALSQLEMVRPWANNIKNDSIFISYLFLKGSCEYRMGNYNTALKELSLAKELILKQENNNSRNEQLALVINRIGEVYKYGIRNLTLAKKAINESLQLRLEMHSCSKFDLAISYYNASVVAQEEEHYTLSLEYANSAYNSLMLHPYRRPNFEILCQNLIATIFWSQGKYEKAIEWGQIVVRERKIHAPDNYFLLAMEHLNLANYYLDSQDYNNAEKVCKELKYYLEKDNDSTSENYAIYLWIMGEIAKSKDDIAYIDLQIKSINNNAKRYSPLHWTALDGIRQLSSSLIEDGAFNLASPLLKDVIRAGRKKENLSQNQNMELAGIHYNYATLLSRTNQSIDSILKYFKSFDEHLERARMSATEGDTKISFSNLFHTYYAEIISTLCQLRNKNPSLNNDLFQYIEKSKALLLWESFIETQLFDKSILSDSVQLKLSLLEAEINELELQKHENKDHAFIYLDLAKNKRKSIIESLKTTELSNNPYLTGYAIPSLEEVQNKLRPDENILNFIQTDSNIFMLLVKNEESHFFNIKTGSRFNSALKNHLDRNYLLDDKVLSDKYKFDFIQDAYLLYQSFDTIFKSIPKNQKVIIVPDGQLSFLPFESLLSSSILFSKPYNDYPFLVHEYQFSYTYSASVWSVLQEEEKIERKIEISAFGPLDNAGLINAQKEIDFISKYFKSTTFNGSNSGKQKFLSQIHNNHNIHLAIHGKSDTTEIGRSFLSFGALDDEENKLYDYEIAASRIEAPLMVMNACETAAGKNYIGEGVLSLSRSMVQAGCKNVVSSLWQVDDEVGFTLTKSFYNQLSKGVDVSAALRSAKIKHLSTSVEILAHPYFWATLVHTGNDQANIPRKRNGKFLLFLLIIPIIGILFFLKSKKSGKSPV